MTTRNYGPYQFTKDVEEDGESIYRTQEELEAEFSAESEVLKGAINRAIFKAARESFLVFLRLKYGINCPEPERILHPHQIVVANDLQKIYDSKYHRVQADLSSALLKYWITAPRGFVKTSTIADYIAWRIGNDPSLRIKLVTQNERRAVKQLGDMARYMMYSPVYHAVFPDIEIASNNNRTQFNVVRVAGTVDQRDPTIEASGYNASPEGSRADIIWFDDVCSYSNSVREEKERENIKEKLRASWFPISEGPLVEMYWSCTLFHDEDASQMLLKSPGWTKRYMRIARDFSGIEDVLESTLYPLPEYRWATPKKRFERWWGRDELIQLHDEDPEAFRISHFLETVTARSDRAKFTRESIWGPDGMVSFSDMWKERAKSSNVYDSELVVVGVDLAFSSSSVSANTAMTVVGLEAELGRRVIIDSIYGKGMPLMEKLSNLKMLMELYSPDLIVIEDNAAQKMLIEFLQESQLFDVTIESHTTDMTKDSKLALMSREMRDGKWVMPFDDEKIHGQHSGCKCGRCLLIKEMIGYPDYATSDVLMSTLFARHGLKLLGVGSMGLSMDTISI